MERTNQNIKTCLFTQKFLRSLDTLRNIPEIESYEAETISDISNRMEHTGYLSSW